MAKRLSLILAGAILFAAGYWSGHGRAAEAAGNRVFELRTYTALPGKLPDLHARFRNHTIKLFEKHGITNIGYFQPQDAPLRDTRLIYLLAHSSREAARRASTRSARIPPGSRRAPNRRRAARSWRRWSRFFSIRSTSLR